MMLSSIRSLGPPVRCLWNIDPFKFLRFLTEVAVMDFLSSRRPVSLIEISPRLWSMFPVMVDS